MMAQRIERPSTAFAGPRQRRPRELAAGHLAFIRRLPCAVCGRDGATEAAHLRIGSPMYGKRHTGAAEKPSDCWTTPLCFHHHNGGPGSQHAAGDELNWWRSFGIDPFALALALWRCSGDLEVGRTVVREFRLAGASKGPTSR